MIGVRSLGALRLFRDQNGTMVIETALVAPILIMLSIGGFEVSSMVARQSELQSAAGEAVAIVMAASPTNATEFDQIEAVVEESSGIPEEDVTVALRYRCGTEDDLITDPTICAIPETLSSFMVITMSDQYNPVWTTFGIGAPIDFSVVRSVQLS